MIDTNENAIKIIFILSINYILKKQTNIESLIINFNSLYINIYKAETVEIHSFLFFIYYCSNVSLFNF
jgi:hypothetical protein